MSENSVLRLYCDASERRFSAVATLGDQRVSGEIASPKRTMEDMFPLIVSLLEKLERKLADVDEIYVTTGPGANTGLRMAITFARVLFALKSQLAVYGASTEDVLRAGAGLDDAVTLISDRHRALFYAVFKGGVKVAYGRAETPDQLPEPTLPRVAAREDEGALAAVPEARAVSILQALPHAEAYRCYTPDEVDKLVPIYSEKV